MKSIIVNGVEYVEKSKNKEVTGERYVVVISSGWIYAGDVVRENGRIYLHNAVWVFKWSSIEFIGMINDPKNENVQLRKVDNVIEIPESSEIYSVKVCEDWGL